MFVSHTKLIAARDRVSSPILDLLPFETEQGASLSTQPLVRKILSDFINNHTELSVAPPQQIELVWTVDYAKCGWTFGGFQLVGHNLNQHSSANYCVSTAYYNVDSHECLQLNCSDAIEFLNNQNGTTRYLYIQLNSGTWHRIEVIRNILLDFKGTEAVLGQSVSCWLCGVDDEQVSNDLK